MDRNRGRVAIQSVICIVTGSTAVVGWEEERRVEGHRSRQWWRQWQQQQQRLVIDIRDLALPPDPASQSASLQQHWTHWTHSAKMAASRCTHWTPQQTSLYFHVANCACHAYVAGIESAVLRFRLMQHTTIQWCTEAQVIEFFCKGSHSVNKTLKKLHK